MDPNQPVRPIATLPPPGWLTENPDWATVAPGRGLAVQHDPTHPDAGRVCGFVTPPDGAACYMNDTTRCRPTPGASPDGYRTFHADMVTFDRADGSQVEIGVGSIPLGGGHSDQMMVAAQTPAESRDWLQRRARWRRLAGDTAMYGHVEFIPGQGHLFRGWLAPHVSVAEAQAIALTVSSGEWMPDPELDNQLVFTGVTRVDRTALPMRPIAADLDDTPCGCGQLVVSYLDEQLSGDETMPPLSINAAVEDELAELRATVATLVTRVDAAEEELATLAALAVESEAAAGDGPNVSLEAILERLIEVEALSVDARRVVDERDREISSLQDQLANQSQQTAATSAAVAR